MSRCKMVLVPIAVVLLLLVPQVAQAQFGLVPGSTSVGSTDAEGGLESQAGGHPASLSIHFELKTVGEETEGGTARDAIVDLPPGFFGNPKATPVCTREEFDGFRATCPLDTQIGVLKAIIVGIGEVILPVFNAQPPRGFVAEFGVNSLGFESQQYATVRSGEGYGIRVTATNFPLPVLSATETIWGIPADSSHDAERGEETLDGTDPPTSSEAPHLPFLTLPTSCGGGFEVGVKVDSVLAPGAFVGETAKLLDAGAQPAPIVGCDAVPFNPSVSAQPTSTAAGSSSGLGFELKLPNEGLLTNGGVSETEPVKTEVTLPAGMVVNPSAANGIVGCSPAQYAAATGAPGVGCPEASKVGTLVAKTPLLEEAIEGSVYLATPHENPSGSLLALYIVALAPERGVLVKQAGEVRADPATGQLTAVFNELPPLPYSSFEFDLREGARAPLITPQLCGEYATVAKLYPYSAPGSPVERTAPFRIVSGAGGGGCVSGEGQLPNKPTLEAGVTTPVAGAYSPFVFRVKRGDGEQQLSSVSATLPEGLLGRIAGVPYCPESGIAKAGSRTQEGGGALELASPSCPAASQVGTVSVAAGAGSSPYSVQGKVYLAGPYKDAPLSLEIVTPAIAGPFDLGSVAVRAALYVDRATARIRAVSDPLPSILHGIPLDIRTISLQMDRPDFIFNPTSCSTSAVTGEVVTLADQAAALSNPFAVAGCKGLAFKPTLAAATVGEASKANGASLTVKVAQKPGEADIHKVDLTLPKALPARLTTLQKACTEAQFNANPAGCPAGAFIGTAQAVTPVLSVPLVGPAILVSHGGAAFPDVVFLLQADERGSVIQIDLDGKTDIKKGVTYSRFETVPDAPISSFETSLGQGPHSILGVNLPASAKYSLCGQKLSIPTTIVGQNGAQTAQATPIGVTGCSTTLSFMHEVKQKTLTLTVYAPAAGKITATGKGLTSQSKTAKGQESLTITLKQRKAGKQRTTVKVLYTPSTGKDRKKQTKNAKLTFAK